MTARVIAWLVARFNGTYPRMFGIRLIRPAGVDEGVYELRFRGRLPRYWWRRGQLRRHAEVLARGFERGLREPAVEIRIVIDRPLTRREAKLLAAIDAARPEDAHAFALAEATGAGPASNFGTLRVLEDDGLIDGIWGIPGGSRRRWYALTDAGRRARRAAP